MNDFIKYCIKLVNIKNKNKNKKLFYYKYYFIINIILL